MGRNIVLKDLDLNRLYYPAGPEINKDIKLPDKYKVIEIKDNEFDDSIFKEIYDIQLKGDFVIILYPERCTNIIEDIECINNFIDYGCLFVLDCKSLEGDYGRGAKNAAKELLKNKIYSFVVKNHVTDETIKKYLSKYNNYEFILEDAIEDIISGEWVDFMGHVIRKKKLLGIF